MTYLDKDQVLAALDGLLSHWTQEGRDSVHKLLAALPAIGDDDLDAANFIRDQLREALEKSNEVGWNLLADNTALGNELEKLKSALPAIPLDREAIIEAIKNLCYQQMQNVGTDAALARAVFCQDKLLPLIADAENEKLRAALPVLETRIVNAIGGNEVNTSAYNTVEPVKREIEQ